MGAILNVLLGGAGLTTSAFNFTAGQLTGPPNLRGFGAGYGTMNSGGTINGRTIAGCNDDVTDNWCTFSVSGFSTDPGSAWLQKLTSNSVSKLGSAATYNYASGSATWKWTAQTFGFANGNSYPSTVVHG